MSLVGRPSVKEKKTAAARPRPVRVSPGVEAELSKVVDLLREPCEKCGTVQGTEAPLLVKAVATRLEIACGACYTRRASVSFASAADRDRGIEFITRRVS